MAEALQREHVSPWIPAARVGLGLLLLADAWLGWHPATYLSYPSLVYSNASVSPPPLATALVFAAELLGRQPALAGTLLAAVESALALLILTGLLIKWALPATAALTLVIWVFGQGFGLPFAAGSTDLGSGILYSLAAVMLWRAPGTRSLSLDRWLEQDRGGHRRRWVRLGALGGCLALLALALLQARAGATL
ncbi:MAG: hypothetical protein ACREN4_03400 [Candidatus Dormibacteria bacterium]